MNETSRQQPISWERTRAIFGNADPPPVVWEQQFDYMDDVLRRIAATPFREITREDLGCYFQDLNYVELQPDLFNYLFPICLMAWHDTLMDGTSVSAFHRALASAKILDNMLTSLQREHVVAFFRDSFLERLDRERATTEFIPDSAVHPFGWICRFNSLGIVLPSIEPIWEPWWRLETSGRAIAALKYCSGLVYYSGENRIFGIEIPGRGWQGPENWQQDSDQGWSESNLTFLCNTLNFDY